MFFIITGSLKRHLESIHMNIKNHACGLCGKHFKRKEYLRSHMGYHDSSLKKKPKNTKSEQSKTSEGEEINYENKIVNVYDGEVTEPITIEVSGSKQSTETVTVLQNASAVNDLQNSESAAVTVVQNEATAVSMLTKIQEASELSMFSQADNTYYAIQTRDDNDQPQTVVYGYPSVQYEVECSSGVDQLDNEALSAINLLAQASASQEEAGETITFVSNNY